MRRSLLWSVWQNSNTCAHVKICLCVCVHVSACQSVFECQCVIVLAEDSSLPSTFMPDDESPEGIEVGVASCRGG